MPLPFPAGSARESLGRWECKTLGPEPCGWRWCWHRVVMVHWGSAPVALEQIEPSCRQWWWQGTISALLSPLTLVKEIKYESSPVLPSSLGRRCHHPVLLCQEWGMYEAPKKLFFSWSWMATSQDRLLSGRQHPWTHTALWHNCLRARVCAGRGSPAPGTATRTSRRAAWGPVISQPPSSSLQLQTHIRGARLSHPNQCWCLQVSPGSCLLELSLHRGCRTDVPTGGAASPTMLRVLV